VTAVDALCVILDSGGKTMPGPGRPRLLAPPRMRPLVDAHREELRALVDAYGNCTADVFRRAQAFRQQIAEWTTSNHPGVPLLVRPGSPAPVPGHCVSCGITIEAGWRCGVCLRAAYVALGLADTEPEESTAGASARCKRHPITRRADICSSCRPAAKPRRRR
jgi:hypothetical protein